VVDAADVSTEVLFGVEGDSGLAVRDASPMCEAVRRGGVFCVEAGRAGQANLMHGRRGAS
jgi:hypothetical protein